MEIIETPIFTKMIGDVLSDEEYRELQWALLLNPKVGVVIPGGAGLRKLRWHFSGSGKRGGLRVIYYFYSEDEAIYLLFSYKKSQQNALTRAQIKILREYVKGGVL